MRYLFFVGIPHQKEHFKFVYSVLGGEYVSCSFDINTKDIPEEILAKDGKDIIWFFSDIYYHLHSQLKGKQVLTKHGLCFGPWLNTQRAECINKHIDMVFQPGLTQEYPYRKFKVIPEKIKPAGYTILFEIPDVPSRENAVLFSSTCFRHWDHYDNLKGILRNIDPDIDGYLSIHPETSLPLKGPLLDICSQKKNLTLIKSQEELLHAYAFCSYNVSGGLSSVGSPFWFQKKPVIFIRGRVGLNPLKGFGWGRIKRDVGEPLFDEILDQSIKISHWKQFNPALLFKAKPAPSAIKIFYPWNFDINKTKQKIHQYIEELET
jgi:hypothetical protein